MAPEAEASIVFVATTPILRSVPESVEPALKPNHPKARIRHPESAIGRLWPGIACATPFTNFPILGPSTMTPVNAITPPVRWTTPEPAKSTYPWPSPTYLPRVESQPPPHAHAAKIGYIIIDAAN